MSDTTPIGAGDLTRLLETERRLSQRLRSARAEADALVAQAQAEAARREAALAAELETEQRQSEERLIREQHDRERDIADTAQHQVEAFRRIGAARLAELAKVLAGRLLEEDLGP